jgi:hypothetical protein
MKACLTFLVVLASALPCMAGGSIGWEDVSSRLSRTAPELLRVINDSFEVAPGGGALRLGPHSLDVIEGRAEVGTKVPPYEFDCKPKGKPGPFFLRLRVEESESGWQFIVQVTSPHKA